MQQYQAHLRNLADRTRRTVVAASFSIREEYNSGWTGVATLYSRADAPLTIGEMLTAVRMRGIDAGTPMALCLALDTRESARRGEIIRSWPSVVYQLEPFQPEQEVLGAGCWVRFADPITYLSNRTIWGAYRGESAGAMLGGAVSLAAGGDGKPALEPSLPAGLPPVTIRESCRESLSEIPYAIAAGQTLAEWLGEVLSMLALRVEMLGDAEGSITALLTDKLPLLTTKAMSMTVLDGEEDGQPTNGAGGSNGGAGAGPIHISGFRANPGKRWRGIVLDNPQQGPFRYYGPAGAVGRAFAGAVDFEEAARRSMFDLRGAFAEMLAVSAMTRQPALRPGRVIELDVAVNGQKLWQIARVDHSLKSAVYDNAATLLNARTSWHAALPPVHGPIFVTGVVDGGTDLIRNEPVPRDRMGRIPISFPFTPTPVDEEAALLKHHDSDSDKRVTLADFTESQIKSYEDDQTSWEEKAAKHRAGDYEDPYPGRTNADLNAEEVANRERLGQERRDATGYIAYKRAKEIDEQDHDRDGYLSSRDNLISDDLKKILKDSEDLETLDSQWESRQAGTLDEDFPDIEEGSDRMSLIEKYGALFDSGFEDNDKNADNDADNKTYVEARKDAELASQRWPPRIPLGVVEPMAGGLHGFITAHRQDDACRVAVYDPFWAEIVGFQYRNDRRTNAELSEEAIAAMVVEHDYGQAWSGLVFRRAPDSETAAVTDDETDDDDDETDDDDDETDDDDDDETDDDETDTR